MKNWKVTRFGHASKGRGNTRINTELRDSLSRNRISASLLYIGSQSTRSTEAEGCLHGIQINAMKSGNR